MAITHTLSGPVDRNLIKGRSYEMTATANSAVPTDTMVVIEGDYSGQPILIEAGETTGITTLTVTESGLPDGTNPGETLMLFGSVDGMEIGELTSPSGRPRCRRGRGPCCSGRCCCGAVRARGRDGGQVLKTLYEIRQRLRALNPCPCPKIGT